MLKPFQHIFECKVFNYKRSQIINVPSNIIYDTILDVPKYSNFLPWCQKSIWLNDATLLDGSLSKGHRNALLTVQFAILKESYISRVIFEDHKYIQAVAADSTVFEVLDTNWEIKGIDDRTLVNFYICYKFNNQLYQQISTSFSNALTKTLLDRFIKEAQLRYYNELKPVGCHKIPELKC